MKIMSKHIHRHSAKKHFDDDDEFGGHFTSSVAGKKEPSWKKKMVMVVWCLEAGAEEEEDQAILVLAKSFLIGLPQRRQIEKCPGPTSCPIVWLKCGEADFFQMTPYHNSIWKWELEVLETFENPVLSRKKFAAGEKNRRRNFEKKLLFWDTIIFHFYS